MISYFTGMPAADNARPPLEYAGLVCVVVGEAKRLGPMIRPPEEATIQMIHADSGRLLWQTKQPLNGRRTSLSWIFSLRSLIVTTGAAVYSYDLSSGERLWSTTVEDVRSLRLANGVEREIVLADFDARNSLQPRCRKRSRRTPSLPPGFARTAG